MRKLRQIRLRVGLKKRNEIFGRVKGKARNQQHSKRRNERWFQKETKRMAGAGEPNNFIDASPELLCESKANKT